jgi:two-component system KDP operon response regulator KdpE
MLKGFKSMSTTPILIQATILVVDDDASVLQMLKRNLTNEGYKVLTANSGIEALVSLEKNRPDLMLLDINMPELDGLEVCRNVRKWNQLPIIVLSARNEEHQKVEALELGADDYLTKPFGINELIARVHVALRRVKRQTKNETISIFTFDDLTVNLEERKVLLSGEEIKLTPQQYELLKYLVINAGRVITHRAALLHVWGPAYEGETQYLHVFIGQLRRKIEPDLSRPRYILTERGLGYRFYPGS